MPFVQDATLPQDVDKFFGDYRATFRSEHGQIVAHLFVQGHWLIAHVSLPVGLELDKVTDSYLSQLHEFARNEGFENKFRIIYAG